jgi:pimeloyl-ACP methyl ester carboxylesterase
MAAQSPEAESGAEPEGNLWDCLLGRGLWGSHGVELVRVTAIDLAVLAGHMLLYPTGILPERMAGSSAPAAAGGNTPNALPPPTKLLTEGRAHPPVLLLHGFVDNRSAFTMLRRSLLQHGWTRVQALNYSPLTSDIRTAAEQLGPHIEQVCEQSGHRRVDIVAHSLGGLVARYYVQRLGGDARVRTLVTLGTPHSGTRAVPALAPHPLARQMRPGSPVLTELAAPAKGCRTRFVAFWSDLDQLMIPVEAARLEHPDLRTKNIKVSGIGHLSLPVHGTVAAEIRQELGERGSLGRAGGETDAA